MNYIDETLTQSLKFFVMAPLIKDKILNEITAFCEQHGVNLEGEFETISLECASVIINLEPQQVSNFRVQMRALAVELKVDLVLLDSCEAHKVRKLAVFDMDSTLIQVEVIDELAKRAGVGEQVMSITAAAMRGELDFNQSFEQRLGLLKGLSESVLADIASSLPIMPGMEILISTLQQKGYKTAILSGGFSYFAKYLQADYGFDYVYSNELEIADGKVTGEVVGTIVNGERKVSYLKEIAAIENIDLSDTIAVGDGANDLPMLAVANLGIAFHAKPLVVEKAQHSISTLGLDALLYLL